MNRPVDPRSHAKVAAAIAFKVVELAKSWGQTAVHFEAGQRGAAYLVELEMDDGRYIKVLLPTTTKQTIINLEMQSGRGVVKKILFSLKQLENFITQASFLTRPQITQATDFDAEAIDWDSLLHEQQPRSEIIDLLRTMR